MLLLHYVVSTHMEAVTDKLIVRLQKLEDLVTTNSSGKHPRSDPLRPAQSTTLMSSSSKFQSVFSDISSDDLSSTNSTQASPLKRKKQHKKKQQSKKRKNTRSSSSTKKKRKTAVTEDSNSEATVKTSTDLVKQLLQATGLSNKKKKGKKDFPRHLYIIRNDRYNQEKLPGMSIYQL